VIGQRVSELIGSHERDADGNDGAHRGHVELRLPNGETRWLAYSAKRMKAPIGGAVAYLRDETERRRDELRLSRQNDELEQTVRALAHDLRSRWSRCSASAPLARRLWARPSASAAPISWIASPKRPHDGELDPGPLDLRGSATPASAAWRWTRARFCCN
jgi:hypothetical protein